jgi:putative alpha-1,2-mannosidase
VQKRIALSGGKDNLTRQLDKFFAFNEDSDVLDRFEGFNNETDMETPYFYHYVGRYDRLATIMQECMDSCYTTGPDGLPGNNDSGGLSACYIWNFLGLFPISGQDAMFIGYPTVKEAVLHLSNGKDLTIKSSVKDGKLNKVVFNGQVVNTYKIQINDLLKGGELVFS